ncbi:MAG TPA: hypothetical protein PLF13_02310 [candidate division Zixibacteria bacterium]|nr:hypothetical protein [candidate division Zixibacteria bacterium]
MKKQIYLLLACVALYFIISAALQVTYGPSYGWFEGEDHWEPDGQGGWVMHGHPAKPMPTEPSVYIPIILLYLPVFVPGLLLALFLFTPLSRKLETPRPQEQEEEPAIPTDDPGE